MEVNKSVVAESRLNMNSSPISLSNDDYKLIFDNSALAITVVDPQERLVLWNKFAEKLLRMSSEQLYLKPISEIYPEEEWRRVRLENIRQKGTNNHIETKIVTGDRKILDVDLSIGILRRPDGSINGSIGIIRDLSGRKRTTQALEEKITHLKQVEKTLRESEAFNSILFMNSPNPIVFTDQDYSIKYVNPALEQLTGFTSEELIGRKPPYPWWPPDKYEQYEKANIDNKENDVKDLERCCIKKNGEIFWVAVYIKAVKEENQTKYHISNWVDITKHKLAESALKYSEVKFRKLVENAPLGIALTTLDGRFLSFNKAIMEIFGYETEAQLLENPITFRYANQEDREKLLEHLESGGKVNNFVIRMKKKSGELIWCSLNSSAQVSENGDEYLITTIEDISQRQEMAAALEKAKSDAEVATRAKSDFLAHMSHEIRTPMNAIVGLSHLSLKTDLTPKQHDYLSKIQSSADALMGIINDILDLSKVEAGKIEIENADFRLDQLFNNLNNLFSPKITEKGLKLFFDTAAEVPLALKGDSLRLSQILNNLLSNAIKFTETGKITVSTRLASSSSGRATIRFAVRDTGIGMSREQMSKLFQPFTQADSSTTRKYGGTGLGLIISKHLAQLMGGEISVESQSGCGSTFSFTIDAGVQAMGDQNKSKVVPESLCGLRVLVADDDAVDTQILHQMLTNMKFETTVVNSGQAALRELQTAQQPYDLVILDWRMPDMDGFETARRIRSNLNLPSSPKIFIVTAYGRQEVAQQTRLLGLDAFLVKPVGYSILLDNIMEAFCQRVTLHHDVVSTLSESGTLTGGKVLVVEDNAINQQVARELLEGFGLNVEIASNGREAVEMVLRQNKSFNAVLMDLQMPEMDGYQATAVLRANLNYNRLPIIAMTAHAMQSEIQHCLDTGMNDCVTKPVDPEKLKSVLLRWIKTPSVSPENVISSPSQNTPGLKTDGNIPGIDMTAALKRLMGNEQLLVRLLRDFALNNVDSVKNVRSEIEKGDLISAQKQVHTLKGVAGNLSAIEVFEAAQALESFIRGGDQESILSGLEILDGTLRPIIQWFVSPISEADTGKAGETSDDRFSEPEIENLGTLILELDDRLKKHSLSARKVFDKLKEELGHDGWDKRLGQLEACLHQLDFKGAREQLNEVKLKLGVSQ